MMSRPKAKNALRDGSGRELSGRLIELGGCDTYVVSAGNGPVVVLLHGYGDSSEGWRKIVPALLRTHRVISVDLPSFGRSSAPADGDLVGHYTRCFGDLFELLDVDSAMLVGHSLGGAIALTIALEEPQAVDRLALIAPAGLGEAAPWWWHAIAGTYINWQAMLALPNPLARMIIRGCMRTFLRQRLVHDARRMEELIEDFVEMHGGRRELAALFESGRALIKGYDGRLLERAGAKLTAPVSVIWGSHDRLADPTHARAFRAAVPHAEINVLGRCGHYPQMEFPTRVNEILGEFACRPRRALAGKELPQAKAA
jgi:pimeloyl-ACP methyl ester carboxylesterase